MGGVHLSAVPPPLARMLGCQGHPSSQKTTHASMPFLPRASTKTRTWRRGNASENSVFGGARMTRRLNHRRPSRSTGEIVIARRASFACWRAKTGFSAARPTWPYKAVTAKPPCPASDPASVGVSKSRSSALSMLQHNLPFRLAVIATVKGNFERST